MFKEMKVILCSCVNSFFLNRILIGLLIVLIVFQCGCKESEPISGRYSDPYDDAFKEKNIDYMISDVISKNGIRFKDSTKFDKNGRVIFFKEYGLQEWKAYDSMGYLTRYSKQDDTPKNFWITYVHQPSTLIQKWNVLKHPDKGSSSKDTSYLYNTIIYRFSKHGNVIDRTDQIEGDIATYQYDLENRLVKKILKSMRTGLSVGEWNYTYDKRGVIEMIVFEDKEDQILKHYFNNGRLDSTRSSEYLTTYTYKYFDR